MEDVARGKVAMMPKGIDSNSAEKVTVLESTADMYGYGKMYGGKYSGMHGIRQLAFDRSPYIIAFCV
jgi:hypothetical protein